MKMTTNWLINQSICTVIYIVSLSNVALLMYAIEMTKNQLNQLIVEYNMLITLIHTISKSF